MAALALAGGGQALVTPTRQPLLDDAARDAYARRARELTVELDEAEARADHDRAEWIRLEFDAIADEVDRATALGGRRAVFDDAGERARTAVRKAIKRAIDEIAAADAELGRLLASTVTTGFSCAYRPDPAHPVDWHVAAPPAPG